MTNRTDRIVATYDIETPSGLAHAAAVLAGEQSTGTFVKLAAETDELRQKSAATVETVTPTGKSSIASLPCRVMGDVYERGLVRVSWPVGNLGYALPNLLSTLAGNLFELAELSAIRLIDIELPKSYVQQQPGPQFGVLGTRQVLHDHQGPVIGTIIKPSVGLGAEDTAKLVGTLAEAGIDFIKDDELQANGPDCPLADRLNAVMNTLNRYRDKTGRQVMYAVNITDEISQMWRNLELVQESGAICAMVCVQSVGLTGLRAVRDRSSVPVHGHRAGWGLLSRSPNIGISFQVMQKLWRLAGADHLHVNGLANKFTEPDSVVAMAAKSVQEPVSVSGGANHIAMPVFSSGQTIWQIGPTHRLLANDDFIFCAGGGIMSHPGGARDGVIALREAAAAARTGIPIQQFAEAGSPLEKAIAAFKQPVINL